MSETQEKTADAAEESSRLHKDGFARVDTRLTSIERGQSDQTKILADVRAEMVDVNDSRINPGACRSGGIEYPKHCPRAAR